MDNRVIEYVVYLPTSVAITVWVATTLYRHGRRFLIDVFHGDDSLADSVNHLLVVGFYLVNLGYVSLQMKIDATPEDTAAIIESLATKVGFVLLVLGAMHFANLFILARLRAGARFSQQPQPPAPTPDVPQWKPLPDAPAGS